MKMKMMSVPQERVVELSVKHLETLKVLLDNELEHAREQGIAELDAESLRWYADVMELEELLGKCSSI